MGYHEQIDNQPAGQHHWGDEVAVAAGFLTILPVPPVTFYPGLLGQSGRWFPVVGALIGLLLSGGQWGLSFLFPPLVVAVLTTILWAGLTGGLHLDGFADCCDGLLAAVPPERRLEIMRDPRTGAFAVIGLVLLLFLKTACIAAIPHALPALLVVPVWARWLLLWIARRPAARGTGLGAEFHSTLTSSTLWIGLLFPLLLTLIFFHWQLLLAVAVAVGTTWAIMRTARRRLGGNTGDVFGLTVELNEVVMLLIFSIGAPL